MICKFTQQKENAIKRLEAARKKGEVDLEIMHLLDYINSLPDFYTTSSCSGRITLTKDAGCKLESSWVGKWHQVVSFDDVMCAFCRRPDKGLIWFTFDPLIMHVVARELGGAKELMVIARNFGFKKVGVIALNEGRNIVEICGTEKIWVPVAEDAKALVDEEYLRYLVGLANKYFETGIRRLKRFEAGLGEGLS